ncbi:MAG: glycosyltransferase [Planctomycetota bacterium]
MAGKNKVLYVNPFSSDLLGEKKSLARRIPRKMKSIAKCLKRLENNLYVFSPVFLPVQGKQITDNFNNILLKFQLNLACQSIEIKTPILWVENLRAADMLDSFNPKVIVFHVSDLFSKSRYVGNKEKLKEREESITAKSDLVICVSQALYEIKSAHHDNVFYLPHAVDYELFREAADKNIRLAEVAHIPKPIVGYYGTMTANNDIDLLLWCARRLSEVSFVLVGQITSGDYSELVQLPNVYILGKIPYEKIPFLCASFDVCLLQWKMTEWIRCCNPLKMMEYMASGRPIVSVPIQEVVDKYSDVVSVAYNKEEFCQAIVWELQNDTPERAGRRTGIAEKHTWDTHIEKASQLIKDAACAKKRETEKKLSGQKEQCSSSTK